MNVTHPSTAAPVVAGLPATASRRTTVAIARRGIPWALLAVALLAAFGLRLYQLGDQSIWGDEIYSQTYTLMGWLEIIRFNVTMRDPQPPLYYFALKAFVSFAGLSEFSLRYLSVLAGVGAIAAVFTLGRLLAGAAVGALAALILAVNPYHVWYGQETRTYTLTTLLALLSMLLFVRILKRDTVLSTWLGFVVVSTLLVYSHYFGFLLLLFYNVAWVALRGARGLSWRRWLLAQSAFVLPYLPFAPHGLQMMAGFSSINQSDLSWSFLGRSLASYTLGWFIDPGVASMLMLGFTAILLVGITAPFWLLREQSEAEATRPGWWAALRSRLAERRRDPSRFRAWEQVLLLVGFIVIPVVAAVLALQLTDRVLLQDRYFILITPAYYLLLAIGINTLRRLWLPLGAVALAFVLIVSATSVGAYFTQPQFARYDVKGLAQHVFREGQPGDVVVDLAPIHDYFVYYYKGPLEVRTIGRGQPEAIAAELAPIAQQYRRIWLVPYADGDLDRAAESWLDRYGFRLDARWFKTARVRLYSFPISGQTPLVGPQHVPLEHGITLVQSRLGTNRIAAGQPAEVRLDWQGLPADDGYRAIVRLVDPDGHAIAHNDRPLQEGGFADAALNATGINLAVTVPFGTPPGTYHLVAGLRRPDGSDVALVDDKGTTLGTAISLTSIEVQRPKVAQSPDLVETGRRLDRDLGGRVRLVGVSTPQAQLQAGQPLQVVLVWQALGAAPPQLDLVGRIVDAAGNVVGEQRATTATRHYPPTRWAAGEIVRDYLDLPTGRAQGNGVYQVWLETTTAGGAQTVDLGSIQIAGRQRSFDAPQAQQAVGAELDGLAQLIGFDLAAPRQAGGYRVEAGKPLVATLYWRPTATTGVNYTVFVQLLDAGGRLVSQHDGMPAGNRAPTSSWVPGEYVADRHELPVPAAAEPETYQLIAGLYDRRTGQRLKLPGGADFVKLADVVVDSGGR